MENSAPSPELTAFLRGEIDAANFHHLDHVRMGFELVREREFPAAAVAYSSALKRIAAQAGRPRAYHETITLAFLSLITERSARSGEATFDAFMQENPDLLDKSILSNWYTTERLACDLARRTFLLPDETK
jgi:hypothetical protein